MPSLSPNFQSLLDPYSPPTYDPFPMFLERGPQDLYRHNEALRCEAHLLHLLETEPDRCEFTMSDLVKSRLRTDMKTPLPGPNPMLAALDAAAIMFAEFIMSNVPTDGGHGFTDGELTAAGTRRREIFQDLVDVLRAEGMDEKRAGVLTDAITVRAVVRKAIRGHQTARQPSAGNDKDSSGLSQRDSAFANDAKSIPRPLNPKPTRVTTLEPDIVDDGRRLALIPNEPNHPDGNSVWITTTEHKNRWMKRRGVARPLPQLQRSKIVVKQTTDGMGLGVFATEDIKKYEPILFERPLIVSSTEMELDLYTHVRALAAGGGMSQDANAAMERLQRCLGIALNRMSQKNKQAFMSLAISHSNEWSGPVLGRIRTNGFEAKFKDPVLDGAIPYAAVVNVGSRFNHSCCSDVIFQFLPDSFGMLFQAARNIKAGSQIFVNYVGDDLTRAQRREKLESYGIECKCRVCVNHTTESDMLRKFHGPWTKYWASRAREWLEDPNLTVDVLAPIDATITRLEEDGIEGVNDFLLLHIIKNWVYNKLGMEKEAQQAADLLRNAFACRRIFNLDVI